MLPLRTTGTSAAADGVWAVANGASAARVIPDFSAWRRLNFANGKSISSLITWNDTRPGAGCISDLRWIAGWDGMCCLERERHAAAHRALPLCEDQQRAVAEDKRPVALGKQVSHVEQSLKPA